MNKYSEIPEIRILPMSNKEEGFEESDIQDVQGFFVNEFISVNKGSYRYQSQGINSKEGALILFQFKRGVS